MIDGVVTAQREAIVRLTVYGGNDSRHEVDFVLDTGFSGYISLTVDEIDALDLKRGAPATFRFANGFEDDLTTYRASVLWDNALKDVLVMPLDEVHLLGMHLMSGCTITIEACENGAVHLETDTVDDFDGAIV